MASEMTAASATATPSGIKVNLKENPDEIINFILQLLKTWWDDKIFANPVTDDTCLELARIYGLEHAFSDIFDSKIFERKLRSAFCAIWFYQKQGKKLPEHLDMYDTHKVMTEQEARQVEQILRSKFKFSYRDPVFQSEELMPEQLKSPKENSPFKELRDDIDITIELLQEAAKQECLDLCMLGLSGLLRCSAFKITDKQRFDTMVIQMMLKKPEQERIAHFYSVLDLLGYRPLDMRGKQPHEFACTFFKYVPAQIRIAHKIKKIEGCAAGVALAPT